MFQHTSTPGVADQHTYIPRQWYKAALAVQACSAVVSLCVAVEEDDEELCSGLLL